MNHEHKNLVHARHDCRLCGSTDLVEVFSFGDTPLANSYLRTDELDAPAFVAPLTVNFCNVCKLVQLRDVVDPETLFRHYLYVSGTSKVFVEHFNQYAEHIVERFSLTPSALVVDVGSNDGTLLGHFKDRGVSILGVDPAENIAAQAQASGIPTLPKFFTPDVARQISAEYGKASVLMANNVFAHTDNVAGFVVAVKELLAANGAFVFEVQYLKDLIEQNLFDIVYHEHLLYYHLTPLIPFFKQQGLRVFDVERVSTHGGSIRVYVGWDGGPHATSERVAQTLEAESALNDISTYQAFAQCVREEGEKLRAFLTQTKKEGRRVVGYGAPAKATTLCYALGIDGSMLEYIVDDAVMKQGLFMPGTKIPIKHPDVLYTDKPDYCLILAWNFADSIVKNHQRYTKEGGVFVRPVPEFRVLS